MNEISVCVDYAPDPLVNKNELPVCIDYAPGRPCPSTRKLSKLLISFPKQLKQL